MSSRRFFSRDDDHRGPRSRPGVFSSSQPNRHLSNGRYYGRSRNEHTQPSNMYSCGGTNSVSPWNKANLSTVNNTSEQSAQSSDLLPLNELPAKEKLLVPEILDEEESKVVEKTIDAFKSRGHFDDFRKDILDAIERLPNYKNLKYKVMSCVSKFTARQGPFHMGLKKNLMRDRLRDELLKDSNGFSSWINDLVDELIGANIERRIRSVVQSTLEDFIPEEEPAGVGVSFQFDQQFNSHLPNSSSATNTTESGGGGGGRPDRLPTPPPLVKHYSEELALAKVDSARLESLKTTAETTGNNGAVKNEDSDFDDGGSPVAPRVIEEDDEAVDSSSQPQSSQTAPQLLFNQLAHFSMYPEDAPPELREALMTKNDIASGSGANSCSSVMVDEPPTGVEDIISPEMMDIEDGDSPGPIHHNETWSTEENSTAEELLPTTSIGSNSDNSHTEPGTHSSVLNDDPADQNAAIVSNQIANSASLLITAVPASRSTLGSLLMEKKRLKTEKTVLPAPKASNSDIESISSESDFDSSSSSSDEQTTASVGIAAKSSPNKNKGKVSNARKHSSSSDDFPIATPIQTSPVASRATATHVTRSGRMGKQPRRYSPDTAENFRSPSSSSSRHDHSKKQSKSTPKRFYPGNSPSMLQKPKRERTPAHSPVEVSLEKRKNRSTVSPEPKPPSNSDRSAIGKSKKEVRDKRSPMPKVHLSSRTYRDPKPQDGYSSQDSGRHTSYHHKSSSNRELSKARSPSEMKSDTTFDVRSAIISNVVLDRDSMEFSRNDFLLDSSQETKMSVTTTSSTTTSMSDCELGTDCIERREKNSQEATSSQETVNCEDKVAEIPVKEEPAVFLKSEVVKTKENVEKLGEPESKDSTVGSKNSKVLLPDTKLSEVPKDEFVDDVKLKESKLEKPKAKELEKSDEDDDIEEGEITDSDSSAKPSPASRFSPERFVKQNVDSPNLRQQPALKDAKISMIVAPEVERPPAPPSPPPLKRMKKKHRASNKKWSDSSSSDDSDDSLFERLNKKDKTPGNFRQRMESSVIDVSVTDRMRQHKHRNQDPMRRDDIKKPWWSRDSSQMPQNQILTDRESVKFGRNVKNKDSWLEKDRHQSSHRDRKSFGKEDYRSRDRISRYGRRSRSKSKSSSRHKTHHGCREDSPSRYKSRNSSPTRKSKSCFGLEKRLSMSNKCNTSSSTLAPSATFVSSARALSPEFHQKGELSPPPIVEDKSRKRPRIDMATEHLPRDDTFPKFKHGPMKSVSLSSTKRVPNPPPPIAASPDDASSDSDSNVSSTSESSASSSSSADDGNGTSNRKPQKLRGYSIGHRKQSDEGSMSAYSKHKKRFKKAESSVQPKWNSDQIDSRSVPRSSSKLANSTEEDEDFDDKKSTEISSDEILVSTSHISPRGR